MPAPFDWNRFVEVADRAAGDFHARTAVMTKNTPGSILFSDGLCFCALCELFQVDYIVEAGTGFGASTEMFARYFPPGGSLREIWSVDQAVDPRWQWLRSLLRMPRPDKHVWSAAKGAQEKARLRLSPYPHVTLARGDAHVLTPKVVERFARDGRIGILIDGPKGRRQLELAERLLRQTPSVRFIAVDDIGPIFDHEARGERFRASKYAAFATSDRPFLERYMWINGNRLPKRMTGVPEHPGYGMGILIND